MSYTGFDEMYDNNIIFGSYWQPTVFFGPPVSTAKQTPPFRQAARLISPAEQFARCPFGPGDSEADFDFTLFDGVEGRNVLDDGMNFSSFSFWPVQVDWM